MHAPPDITRGAATRECAHPHGNGLGALPRAFYMRQRTRLSDCREDFTCGSRVVDLVVRRHRHSTEHTNHHARHSRWHSNAADLRCAPPRGVPPREARQTDRQTAEAEPEAREPFFSLSR